MNRSGVFFVALVLVALGLYFVFKSAAKPAAPKAGTPTIPNYSAITDAYGNIIS